MLWSPKSCKNITIYIFTLKRITLGRWVHNQQRNCSKSSLLWTGTPKAWSGITISTSLPWSRGRWVTSLLTTCRSPGYSNSSITASVQTHAHTHEHSRYWEFNDTSKLCHQGANHGVTRSGPGQRMAEQWKRRPNSCKAGDAAWLSAAARSVLFPVVSSSHLTHFAASPLLYKAVISSPLSCSCS